MKFYLIKIAGCSILLQPFFYASLHLARHFIKHTVSVNIKEKNAISAPVIIEPITLVALKVIPKSTTDVKIAPKIPVNKTDKTGQTQAFRVAPEKLADVIRLIARYTTATPKTTHKNAGVTVITAVARRTAAIMPIMTLAVMATTEQLDLHEHIDIFFTSRYNICEIASLSELNKSIFVIFFLV